MQMKKPLAVVGSILLTALAWGIYGPMLHSGQIAMHGSRLRPFLCVGLAYFLVAVIVPLVVLYVRGEQGSWNGRGIVWSFLAGMVGALGALGIIMAFHFGGRAIFVMPLVFGGAPVVNTLFAIVSNKSAQETKPFFLAGLIMVILGAIIVLLFKPGGSNVVQDHSLGLKNFIWVVLALAMVVFCWGVYGPVLHLGQTRMEQSRLRPLICVGTAYFFVAVLFPLLLLGGFGESGQSTVLGVFWSFFAGTAGAVGALGLIIAFAYGGKPIYVMPIVFGGAPVVNTLVSVLGYAGRAPGAFFYAGLILVITGAILVLSFAPAARQSTEKMAAR